MKGYWVCFNGEQPTAIIIITQRQGLAPKNLTSESVSYNVTEATYSDDLGLFTYHLEPDGAFYAMSTEFGWIACVLRPSWVQRTSQQAGMPVDT